VRATESQQEDGESDTPRLLRGATVLVVKGAWYIF